MLLSTPPASFTGNRPSSHFSFDRRPHPPQPAGPAAREGRPSTHPSRTPASGSWIPPPPRQATHWGWPTTPTGARGGRCHRSSASSPSSSPLSCWQQRARRTRVAAPRGFCRPRPSCARAAFASAAGLRHPLLAASRSPGAGSAPTPSRLSGHRREGARAAGTGTTTQRRFDPWR